MFPTVSVPANLHHDLVRDCANGFIAIMSRHVSIGILLMGIPKPPVASSRSREEPVEAGAWEIVVRQ